MTEITKFIGRLFVTALVAASVVLVAHTVFSYALNTSNVNESRAVFADGDVDLMWYESLRILLKLVLSIGLTAVSLTILFGLVEFIAVVWRGADFKTAYLNKVQSNTIKSSLKYDELFDLCEDAVLGCRAKMIKTDKDKGLIKAEIKSKISGLIEDVTIAIRKDGTVLVSSRSVRNFASFYGVANFGHNVKNVRSVIEYIEKRDLKARRIKDDNKAGVGKPLAVLFAFGMTCLIGVAAFLLYRALIP